MNITTCFATGAKYTVNPAMIGSYLYHIERLERGEGVKCKDIKTGKWYSDFDKKVVATKISELIDIVNDLKSRG